MSDTVIQVENLSKSYVIRHQRAKGDGLRHVVEGVIRNPLSAVRDIFRRRNGAREEFWALRDVKFDIKQGELVGVIGHNGAGKSTLLKLLSRITEPTEGRMRLRGRTASLLEVGTGFHPELTGRENIYLNGAILGMPRSEIKAKFDEIVAFAEVEKFLDTPVKRYSSGMYVRLAFAVAAHLEPEILIIDEVLAVGDAAFQRKCIAKMGDVANSGRTVLFVSHNMPMIGRLCDRGILLERGSVVIDGHIDDVIAHYRADLSTRSQERAVDRKDREGTGEIIVTDIEVLCEGENGRIQPMTGQPLTVRVHYRCRPDGPFAASKLNLVFRRDGQLLFVLSTALTRREELQLRDSGVVDFLIPELPLLGGSYTIGIFIECNNRASDVMRNVAEFFVVDGDFHGTGILRPNSAFTDMGVLVNHSCLFRGNGVAEIVDCEP